MTQPQLWLRGAAYTLNDVWEEQHGVAVYASEYMCKQFEEQPMFIIPLDCAEHSNLVVYGQFDTIRLGKIPVPLTAHPDNIKDVL